MQALRNLPLLTLGDDEDEIRVCVVAERGSDDVEAVLRDCLFGL
jgi:hypothetical protein